MVWHLISRWLYRCRSVDICTSGCLGRDSAKKGITTSMDADRPKNLGGRVMADPVISTKGKMNLKNKQWDAFISHASEDKDEVARTLAETLSGFGAKIWYDEFSLSLGDSLSRSIDKGLSGSRFGIVILSKNFFAKDWPEYELKGLVAKELGHDKVIIPLWHNVTREEVLEYSPTLADKLAAIYSEGKHSEICLKILGIIRPDLLSKIHRRTRYKEMLKNAEVIEIDPRKVKFGPIRHKELPRELIGRIRLIRAALWGVDTHSMAYWLDGFKRDSHPSQEVAWWEHVAACYVEFSKAKAASEEQCRAAYRVILTLCNKYDGNFQREIDILGQKNFDLLKNMCEYISPMLDVEENFPDVTEMNEAENNISMNDSDIEDFDLSPGEG